MFHVWQNQTFRYSNILGVTAFKYSAIKTKRLNEKSDKICQDYGQENLYGYYRMRSDCLTECYQDKIRKICNDSYNFFPCISLLRSEYFSTPNMKVKICNKIIYNGHFEELKTHCMKFCIIDCNFVYFNVDLYVDIKRRSHIGIERDNAKVIIINYIPEMDLMNFICNFGGLLGIWLGFSIFSTFKYFLEKVVKAIKIKAKNLKKYTVKKFNKSRWQKIICRILFFKNRHCEFNSSKSYITIITVITFSG